MNAFLKNYGSTLALLGGILIGGTCGLIFGEGASVVKPVGDLFLNLIYVMVVPLVFFSIAGSICNMRESGMLGKVLGCSVLVFVLMSLFASVISYLSMLAFDPLAGVDKSALLDSVSSSAQTREGSVADTVVGALTVPDFGLLLSKGHLLALIVFAALFGYSVGAVGPKGAPMASFISSGTEVMMRMMGIVMRLAPIGLGCYFADAVASLGGSLLGGYARIFVIYLVLALIFFFVVGSIYVLAARGVEGLKSYWKHVWTPAMTAIATSSSAAAMPASLEAAKRMGVSPDIADAVIPLGTNIHKDGSAISGVFKVVFLMLLLSQTITGPGAFFTIILVAVLESMVLGAVPNGGLAGEIFICSVLGMSPDLVGIIVLIGAIVDIPATLLNSNFNIVASILVDRIAGRR